jgi:hypothetical protein
MRKEYNRRWESAIEYPGYTLSYAVYFIKHHTKLTMRYGVYNTEKEAQAALNVAQRINTIDTFYVEQLKQYFGKVA